MTRLTYFALGLILASAISVGAQVQIIPAPFNGTWAVNNIVTTSTDGFLLQNTTAATVGVPVQYSPRLRFCGTAWKTDATTASETDCTAVELRPVSAAGATTSILSFLTSINGGSYTQRLSIGSDGTLTASGNITTTAGNVTMGGAASVGWSTVGFLTGGSATGLFLLRNVTVTTGVGLDVATDALLKVRTRALTGDAAISASLYSSTATSTLTFATNTIAPTSAVHHLGAGLIKTITVPATCTATCSIDIVPDAAFTYDATDNVTVPVGGGLALISKTMRFTWDGTKWNPSY